MVAKKKKTEGSGRKKGSLNRVTISAKQAIVLAAEGLGGTDRLIEWAREDAANERVFWGTIFPKLIPLAVGGDPDNPLSLGVKVSFVSAT